MKWLVTGLLWLIALGAIVFFAYPYRGEVKTAAQQLYARFLPCSRPLTYRIVSIDPQFGVSSEELQKTLTKAEEIWEIGSARELFLYDAKEGVVQVSLVYDYRQETVDKLKDLGISIDTDQASYDEIRRRYDSLSADYGRSKAALELKIKSFEAEQEEYNAEVASWNARGGAPQSVYKRLQSEKESLEATRSSLENEQQKLNASVREINTLATTLNRLAEGLHLRVNTYNTIGASTGGEFEEGLYEEKLGEQTITIFEFASELDLRRVLAHEFGHALGLDHVNDEDAIMYKLNQSENGSLTPEDLSELERVCGAT